jgi:DNA polymerase III subunit delta'
VSWRRVRGHDAVVTAFQNAWRRGRLAHAYLFAGPEGVGKKLFAVELAKSLLCEQRAENRLEACDLCSACRQVEARTHPDFFVAARPEDSQTMPIDVMRELGRNLSLKPARGRGKIAIVDDADALDDPITSYAAANCFLKTLEEPPPRSTLILIGTAAERQLLTIVSRCQVVRFRPLPPELLAELLRRQEWCQPQLIERLTRLSGGSLAQAQALADPALWEFRRTLLAGFAQVQPDSVALSKAWLEFVEEAGKESAPKRRRASLVLKLLVELLHDGLTLSLGGQARSVDADDLPVLQKLAERCGPDRLMAALERCLEADTYIDRRVNLDLTLEALTDAVGVKLSA